MRGYSYHAPLDESCPEVVARRESFDDPIMAESGCYEEFWADFERKHRASCKRCQEFGAANIEVV